MWQIIGQNRAVSLLQRSLERGALAHAYLLVGPSHVGKMTLALNLAQALNCERDSPPCEICASCQKIASGKHADIQLIGLDDRGNSKEAKSRTEIGIDQIRQMQHSANLPPFEGRYKVFIIDGAERLSLEAANCLLKTLEEPQEGTVFILLTTNDGLLPSTVVSRCQRLELPPVAIGEVEAALGHGRGVDADKAKLLSRLCHGCPGWGISAVSDDSLLEQRAERVDKLVQIIETVDYEERFAYAVQLAAQFGQDRGPVYEVLGLWLDWWRDLLLIKIGGGDIITNIDRSATLVEMSQRYGLAGIRSAIRSIEAAGEQLRQNASARLVLEILMLDLPRRENG